mmetsp:Transcript_13246/g.19480  ORF Transcript_13246/g.19480 Transcript_13246/m.19480 type:complete len:247 (+) Transcript_13246:117-857(+)
MPAAIDNTTDTVDKGIAFHTTVHKLFEFVVIVPTPIVVSLHCIQVVEETGHPFDAGIFVGVANRIRAFAKVHGWKECLSSFDGSSLAEIIIQFTKVGHARGLDHTTSPPAAPFHISTSLLSKIGCNDTWASFSVTKFPTARLNTFVIPARSTAVDIVKEFLIDFATLELIRFVSPATFWSAPWTCVIPFRCFWNFGLWGAEQGCWSSIPCRMGMSTKFHIRIDSTCHSLSGIFSDACTLGQYIFLV